MKVRRVVTGHTSDGKAIFASDTTVEGITVAILPGFEIHRLWGADETVTFPDDGSPHSCPSYFPPVGGFRFGMFTVPAFSETTLENIDFQAGMKEMEEKLPGVAVHMESDHPGMHTTDTNGT